MINYKSKTHRLTAKNDALIRAVLADERFTVTESGEVFTRANTNGISLLPNGEVRNCDIANGDGYRVLNLRIQKKGRSTRKKLRVHRMVFQKFVGELDCKMVVNHKDGNKANNHRDNLEQIECKENTLHAINELGHSPIRNAVLTFAIAEDIRALSKDGIPYSRISQMYGISKGHISEIVNYKIWNERARYEAEQSTPIPF